MISINKTNLPSNIAKSVCSIVFVTGFSALVLFPKHFASGQSELAKVSANFIEGTPAPANIISIQSIVPTVEESNEQSDTVFQYKVKAGDSLSSIAKEFNTTIKNLIEVNNLSSKAILRVGDGIYIAPTQGFIYQLEEPTNPMVFTNKYNIDLEDFMNVNGIVDPLEPFDKGWELFIPENRERGIALGLLDKPSPSKFNIYTVQPKKKKAVVTKKPTTNVAAKKPAKKPIVAGNNTTTSRKAKYGAPHIIAQWKAKKGRWTGFAPKYCTEGAAQKALWAFPIIDDRRQFKSWAGNANQRFANAQKAGFRVSKVPTEGAILVIARGGSSRSRSYGHVAIVLEVNREDKTIKVEDRNFKGLGIDTQRIIHLNANMTQPVMNSEPFLGFIPKQDTPQWVKDEVAKLKKK